MAVKRKHNDWVYLAVAKLYNEVSDNPKINTHDLTKTMEVIWNQRFPHYPMDYKVLRSIVANLYVLDLKVRRGPRPRQGLYKDSSEFRACFPLKRRLPVRRRHHPTRSRKIERPVPQKTNASPVPGAGVQMLMTTDNGVVNIQIQTNNREVVSRVLDALARTENA